LKKTEKLIAAVATVCLGILLIVLEGTTVQVITSVFGVLLIVLGVLDLLSKDHKMGTMKCLFGALILIFGYVILSAVLYLTAILLLVAAIWWLFDLWRNGCLRWNGWGVLLQYAQPVLLALIGGLLFFHELENMQWVFILAGILTVLEGSLLFISAIQYEN